MLEDTEPDESGTDATRSTARGGLRMPNKTDSRSVVHLRTGGPRVAVIGCGQWGRNIVRNLAELGALGALVDRHPEIVEMLIAKHGGAAMSFDEVLADPAIDAVAVAVPPTAHYDLDRKSTRLNSSHANIS